MPTKDLPKGRPAGGDFAILWRIASLALRYRWRIAIALGATILAAAFS